MPGNGAVRAMHAIPVANGRLLFLAVVIDLYSRRANGDRPGEVNLARPAILPVPAIAGPKPPPFRWGQAWGLCIPIAEASQNR